MAIVTLICMALTLIATCDTRVEYKTQSNTVMFEYLGVAIEVEADMRQELVKAHKVLLKHAPNAIASSCEKFFVMGRGTISAYIIITGPNAHRKDLWIFRAHKYKKKLLINRPKLRMFSLEGRRPATRALGPQLTGVEKDYEAFYFLKGDFSFRLIESKHYLMIPQGGAFEVDIEDDKAPRRNWMALKHLKQRDCPTHGLTPFPWRLYEDRTDGPHPFFIVAIKQPSNDTTIMTRTFTIGGVEVYLKDQKVIYNGTQSMEECKSVEFESCPIFHFEISVAFRENSFCEYSFAVSRISAEVYPCKLSMKVWANRHDLNFSETVHMMVPYDYEGAYNTGGGEAKVEGRDTREVVYDFPVYESKQAVVEGDALLLVACGLFVVALLKTLV